jgi:RHS repeat-associated protein
VVEPHSLTNKPTDPTTGWSYHGARWMAPESGRWLTPDPPVKAPDPKFMGAPWSLHPYQYVEQNPVLYWDPDGRNGRLVDHGLDADVSAAAQRSASEALAVSVATTPVPRASFMAREVLPRVEGGLKVVGGGAAALAGAGLCAVGACALGGPMLVGGGLLAADGYPGLINGSKPRSAPTPLEVLPEEASTGTYAVTALAGPTGAWSKGAPKRSAPRVTNSYEHPGGGPGAARVLSKKERARLSKFDRDQCVYCGAAVTMTPGRSNTVHGDHYVPFRLVPETDPSHMVTSCATCNLQKGGKTVGPGPNEWWPPGWGRRK